MAQSEPKAQRTPNEDVGALSPQEDDVKANSTIRCALALFGLPLVIACGGGDGGGMASEDAFGATGSNTVGSGTVGSSATSPGASAAPTNMLGGVGATDDSMPGMVGSDDAMLGATDDTAPAADDTGAPTTDDNTGITTDATSATDEGAFDDGADEGSVDDALTDDSAADDSFTDDSAADDAMVDDDSLDDGSNDDAADDSVADDGSGNMNDDSTTDDGGGNAACDATGFYVEAATIYDVNCNPFVPRGINVPHAWYASDTESSLSSIAALGANAVRVVLATGDQWTRTDGNVLSNIINWAKANNLVALLEVHDSTGWDESAGAVHPDAAVDYWTSSDIMSAIVGQEAFVMINIANEPFGNTQSQSWSSFHQGAVQSLRNAGLEHLFVVDAPNWGQDWEGTMRDNQGGAASSIFDADPDGNVVFSVHMYDVYGTPDAVQQYFQSFSAHGLALMVGEFAADHGSSGDVAETTIMAEAQTRALGYFGWSWSGNSSDLGSLDVAVSFDSNNLTSWGDTLIYDTNGIANTSEICTCFTQ